jgi:outer membrane lipoprotein carrier protein
MREMSLIWTLLLASALPGARGEEAPKASVQAESPFLFKSTGPLTVPIVIDHLRRFDRDMQSLSARFTQSVAVPDMGSPRTVEGTVAYLRPDRLRIEHLRPEKQTVVTDGKDIWIYRAAQNQAIQSNLEEWKKADPALGNLMQFGDYARMVEAYSASVQGRSLVLRPRSGAQDFTLRLELRPEDLFPQNLELKVGSLSVRTALSEVRFNLPLKSEGFRFSPPASAEVFRNFKPPRLGAPEGK